MMGFRKMDRSFQFFFGIYMLELLTHPGCLLARGKWSFRLGPIPLPETKNGKPSSWWWRASILGAGVDPMYVKFQGGNPPKN